MRLDISMELNRTFNCWQNIIYAIPQYMKTESELLYLHSWNFDFIQEYVHGNNNSTNRYHYIDDYKLLEKVHGLKSTFHDYDNEFPIVELIKKELLESRPVMVAIDTYVCHSVPDYYHKIHRSHFCLVIGMDESEKVLNILDSQYAIKGNTLEVDELMKGITQYVTVKRTEPDDSSIDWISLINESLNSISEEYESPFSDMRCFGEMMKSSDLIEETRGYENDINVKLRMYIFDHLRMYKNVTHHPH